jgi:hypothetical protein
MQININSDRHVSVTEDLIQQWQTEILDSLKRFGEWITRVEVHLNDVNSAAKGGPDDIRCLMEARPAGQKPVSVEVRAASVDEAINQGISALRRRLGDMLEKSRTEARKKQ